MSAPLPLFVDEAAVTADLARRFPGYVPAPLAVQAELGWLLFAEFDVVGWGEPLKTRCELFRRFAGLQRRTVPLVDDLLAAGCLDRRLGVLKSQLDPLFADPVAVAHLTPEEREELSRCAPALRRACRRLDAIGLPSTLVHGDLHPGNAARIDGELAYFDWTDACIAHPLIDLHSLQWVDDESARTTDAGRPISRRGTAPSRPKRSSYAPVVTPLHHAVSYSTIVGKCRAGRPGRSSTRHNEFLRGGARPGARLARWLELLDDVLLSSNTQSDAVAVPAPCASACAHPRRGCCRGRPRCREQAAAGGLRASRIASSARRARTGRCGSSSWAGGRAAAWGSPFAELFARLKPVPMIHIGTDRGGARTEVMTPGGIAAGRGDAYLVALNQAIAAYGGQLYVRVMAEMNNPKNLYAPTRPNGSSKGPSHSPASYRQAFRRAYLILHGGEIDDQLRALGQPAVGRELAVNAAPTLTVIWNPIAGLDTRSARPAQAFYPGDPYVDMVGNDMFANRAGVASHAANEALYRAHPGKPYALPEWGLSIDDPGFVKRICTFLKTRPRTKLAATTTPDRAPRTTSARSRPREPRTGAASPRSAPRRPFGRRAHRRAPSCGSSRIP